MLSNDTLVAIAAARRQLDDDRPSLAAYFLRDLPDTERLGLRDLAWAMASWDAYPHRNDVLYLIDELERRGAQEDAQ